MDRVLSALCHRSPFSESWQCGTLCIPAALLVFPPGHPSCPHPALVTPRSSLTSHAAPTQLNSLISSLQTSPPASGLQSRLPWMLTLVWIKQSLFHPNPLLLQCYCSVGTLLIRLWVSGSEGSSAPGLTWFQLSSLMS